MHLVITQLEAAASNNRKSNISINIRPIGWTVVGYLPNGQHMFKVNNQNAKFKCKLGKSFFFHIEIEFGGGVSLSLSLLIHFISFYFISLIYPFIQSFCSGKLCGNSQTICQIDTRTYTLSLSLFPYLCKYLLVTIMPLVIHWRWRR